MKNLKLRFNTLFSLSLFIFLWIDGSLCAAQSFAPGELINGSGFGYGDIKTFDADRDGDLDILSFPNLYLNDGHGRKQQMMVIGDGKKQYEDYAIQDMDGDKDMDIVVLYKDGEIAVFVNDIKGFTKKEQKNKVIYQPSEYAKLYLYDANSDGICDIIVSGLRGVPVAYTGSRDLQYTYFRPFNEYFPKLNYILGLDLNKDGIEELLVPDYSDRDGGNCSLKVYSYKGGKYVVTNTIVLTTPAIKNIKLMDMDKDGDLDIVYSGGYPAGGIYWLERDAKGGLGKIHKMISPLELEDFQLGDYDADGDIDVAYFTQKNQYTFINWAENKGNDVLVKSQKSLLPNIKPSQSFVFEDFDGDKIKDVFFYDDDNEQIRPQYVMALQQKGGIVKNRNTWMTRTDCTGFVLTDLDNNGTKDVVGYFDNELFYILIDNRGKYGQPVRLTTCPFKIEKLKCADLDDDGKEDLMVSSDDRDKGELGWYKNMGGLKFSNLNVLHNEKERLISFDLIDYDKDGKKDVAINYWPGKTRGFYTYKNMGNGIFSKSRNPVMETSGSFPAMGVLDVDGDDKPDLVDYGSKTWFRYAGSEKWEKQQSPFQEPFIKGIYKARIDNTKLPGYVLLSAQGLEKLKYNGNGQWEKKTIPLDFGIEMIRVGDINGDGYDDVVCLANKYGLAEGYNPDIAFSYKYSIVCLVNDKSGNFVPKVLYPVSDLSNIELLDVDKDGDLDIITSARNWPNGGVVVWKNSQIK